MAESDSNKTIEDDDAKDDSTTSWKEQVDVLLQNVVQELGCEMKSGIHFELYKLLLYRIFLTAQKPNTQPVPIQ